MKKALMTTLLVSALLGALVVSSPAVSEHESHHSGGEQPMATSSAMHGMMEMMAGGMHGMMEMMQHHQDIMAGRNMMDNDSGIMCSGKHDMMEQGMKQQCTTAGADEKSDILDNFFE